MKRLMVSLVAVLAMSLSAGAASAFELRVTPGQVRVTPARLEGSLELKVGANGPHMSNTLHVVSPQVIVTPPQITVTRPPVTVTIDELVTVNRPTITGDILVTFSNNGFSITNTMRVMPGSVRLSPAGQKLVQDAAKKGKAAVLDAERRTKQAVTQAQAELDRAKVEAERQINALAAEARTKAEQAKADLIRLNNEMESRVHAMAGRVRDALARWLLGLPI
jgi:hypothetical protein